MYQVQFLGPPQKSLLARNVQSKVGVHSHKSSIFVTDNIQFSKLHITQAQKSHNFQNCMKLHNTQVSNLHTIILPTTHKLLRVHYINVQSFHCYFVGVFIFPVPKALAHFSKPFPQYKLRYQAFDHIQKGRKLPHHTGHSFKVKYQSIIQENTFKWSNCNMMATSKNPTMLVIICSLKNNNVFKVVP